MTLSSVVVTKPFSSTPSIAMTMPASFPFERALFPLVDEADDEYQQEDHHRGESEEADLRQDDRPREEKRDLEIEQDEQDRDEVIADVEFHPRIFEGLEAAFVGRKLLRVGPMRRHERPDAKQQRANAETEDDEQKNGEILFEHRGSLRVCMPGADGETRTPTAYATAPSRQLVYQFHHVGSITSVLLHSSPARWPERRSSPARPQARLWAAHWSPATHPAHPTPSALPFPSHPVP